jgi:alpha-beta hydrolase superfamily lysophospholipase
MVRGPRSLQSRVARRAAILAAGALLAACSSAPRATPAISPHIVGQHRPAPTTTTTPATVPATADPADFYAPPDHLPPGPPGTIVRAEIVTGVSDVPAGATVWRALYKSQTIYGEPIAVSGYFVVPAGSEPAGGWSVLSWAHGTTGITPSCFPSRFLGATHPYLVPDLNRVLAAGFVVAATDYEGLGGIEPYLLGASEGRGVLDAARAAGHLPGVTTSGTTVIYGHSQGGHAALFAGELAPTYAPDLRVVGVAAAAPATNLSGIVHLAPQTNIAGILAFQLEALWSWAKTYRDLPPGAVLTSRGISAAPGLLAGCLGDTNRALKAQGLHGSDLFNAGLLADPVVISHGQANDPGRVKTGVPVLVVQGTADTTVPSSLTDGYVQNMACPVGDTLDYEKFPGATHGLIPFAAASTVLAFFEARLATSDSGPAPVSTCGQPGDSHTHS